MRYLFILILSLSLHLNTISACTTAVISGKYTTDGRPMLLKHRDTWAINNKIMKFDDGKYAYTGLVNSKDTENKSIWIGFNDQGFAIMNSASYNLNNDTIRLSGQEGRLMKLALQTCKNVEEFEEFIKKLDKPTRLEANFGVIDAEGGAAFFELSNFKYVKYDANNPLVAPYGYIVRTNHSLSGKLGEGGGYIRLTTAESVFQTAIRSKTLNAQTILQHLSRNLTNPFIQSDLNDYANIPENTPTYVPFLDYIPRKSTSSSVVVEGVLKEDDKSLMTMWSVVGWPLASVVTPIWLDKKTDLPQLVKYDKTLKDAPLCNLALQLKERAFTYNWGYSSKYYINVNALVNAQNSGTLQVLRPLEDEIFNKSYSLLRNWRKNGMNRTEMKAFYGWLDQKVPAFYEENFSLKPSLIK